MSSPTQKESSTDPSGDSTTAFAAHEPAASFGARPFTMRSRSPGMTAMWLGRTGTDGMPRWRTDPSAPRVTSTPPKGSSGVRPSHPATVDGPRRCRGGTNSTASSCDGLTLHHIGRPHRCRSAGDGCQTWCTVMRSLP